MYSALQERQKIVTPGADKIDFKIIHLRFTIGFCSDQSSIANRQSSIDVVPISPIKVVDNHDKMGHFTVRQFKKTLRPKHGSRLTEPIRIIYEDKTLGRAGICPITVET